MPLHPTYSPSLVLLSVLIASAASYTALTLAGRVTAARERPERWGWLAGGSLAMGIGIWSMHFVGMLAFHLPVPITYQFARVLMSVLVAIGASMLALVVVSRSRVGVIGLILAALCMGPAIAGMHYIGMAALNVPAAIRWDYRMVALSVGIAVVASLAALTLAYRLRSDEGPDGRARRFGSAIAMGAAIAGMHYTGMAAARFTAPGQTGSPVGGLLATRDLALGVTLGTAIILGLILLGAMADLWIRQRTAVLQRTQQAQRLEAIGQLAGGVAHDFNNLLTAILGNVGLVLAGMPPDDPRQEDLREIERAAERAAELTRQLLAFSRKQVLQPTVVDLNEVLTRIMRMVTRLVGEHVTVTVRPEPGLGRVRADAAQLEQVIVNLVVNARDAMPEGGRLTIETQNVVLDTQFTEQHMGLAPGSYVLMAFTDTGIGMDQAIQSRIFEPFFTTKELGHGTGLGLATVYGIIKQSGGSVSVYSEPGRGSTFKVYLPMVSAEVEPARPREPVAPGHGSETILIVEDESSIHRLAGRVLRAHGYHVLVAGTPADALAVSDAHPGPIHLLLSDVILPEMSGPRLADVITARRPETRVLYMSGFTENAIVQHGVLDDGRQFVQKPFTASTLTASVRAALTRSSAGAAR